MAQHPRIVRISDDAVPPSMQFQITAADTDGAFEWFEMDVPYGSGPLYHSHQRADEVIRVLSGDVKVKLGSMVLDLFAGETCFIPRGVAHAFTNVHPDCPARLLGMYAPAGLQTFLEVWDKLAGGGIPDEVTLAELAARYDQTAIGPTLAVELGLPGTQ